MSSGRYNRPGELFAVTVTYNDAGDPTFVQTKVSDVWLEFVSATAREFMAAQQLNADVTHMIHTRYLPDVTVTPNHILKYDGRTFRILSVIDQREAHAMLVISAAESVKETV